MPHDPEKNRSGGNDMTVAVKDAFDAFRETTLCTSRTSSSTLPVLSDLLDDQGTIFVAAWGFDIPSLQKQLRGKRWLYLSQSTGYSWRLPPLIPILSTTRYGVGWHGYHHPYHYLRQISVCAESAVRPEQERSNDILVFTRKNSGYVLKRILPLLEQEYRVTVVNQWIPAEELTSLFGRSKVFIYDALPHFWKYGSVEGIGLMPLEALHSGCCVFATVSGGMSDYVKFSPQLIQLGTISLEHDISQIRSAIEEWDRTSRSFQPPELHYTTPDEVKGLCEGFERYFEDREQFASRERAKLNRPYYRAMAQFRSLVRLFRAR